MIWTDETNFNLYCKRRDWRSKTGTMGAFVIIPASKGENLHCIVAVTSNDLLLFSKRRRAFKTDDCANWFQELIELCNELRFQEPTIIFGNAPTHCTVETLDEQYPHVQFFFFFFIRTLFLRNFKDPVQFLILAPYSYLLNVIELVWSISKTEMKSNEYTLAESTAK